jgi:hypothetical protein
MRSAPAATSPRRSSTTAPPQGSRERARVPGTRRRAAIRRSYRSMRPDREIEVQGQVIDGEHVVSRWVARGTNRGCRATLTGITISKIADGKIVVRSSPVGAFAQTHPSMGRGTLLASGTPGSRPGARACEELLGTPASVRERCPAGYGFTGDRPACWTSLRSAVRAVAGQGVGMLSSRSVVARAATDESEALVSVYT